MPTQCFAQPVSLTCFPLRQHAGQPRTTTLLFQAQNRSQRSHSPGNVTTTAATQEDTTFSDLGELLRASLNEGQKAPEPVDTGSKAAKSTAKASSLSGQNAQSLNQDSSELSSSSGSSKGAVEAVTDTVEKVGKELQPPEPQVADNATDAAEKVTEKASSSLSKAAEKADNALKGSNVKPPSEPASAAPAAADRVAPSGPIDTATGSGGSSAEQASSRLTPKLDSVPSLDTTPSTTGTAADSAAGTAADAVSSSPSPDLTPGGGPLDSASSAVKDFTQGLFDKAADVKSSATQAFTGVTDDLKEQVDGVSGGLSKQLEGVSDFAGGALQSAASQLDSAKGAASDVVTNFSGQLTDQTSAALSGLPQPIRDVLSVGAAAGSKVIGNPLFVTTAAGAGAIIPVLLWFSRRFGGYSGLLDAETVAAVLDTENSVLLDVRSEDDRLAAGTPDLKFGARNRGVALPLVQLSKQSGTQVVKADVLPFQMAAILVEGLYKVNRGTRVIVLDSSEGRAIKLARAISTQTGLRAYVLQGGFKGWASAGLPVKEGIDYDVTALDNINDTIQGRVLPTVSSTYSKVIVAGLGVVALAAVVDVHSTLEFIGTFSLLATLGTAPLRFSSREEAINGLFGPFLWVAGFFSTLLPNSSNSQSVAVGAGNGESGAPAPEEGSRLEAAPVEAELVDDGDDGVDTNSGSTKAEQESLDTEKARSNA